MSQAVADPRQLSEAQAKQWVAEDLKNMVWHGARLRGHTPPLFHYEMADFLQGSEPRWIDRDKVILGFRFAAKTWLAARQYLKFRWRRCHMMQAVIHSSNDRMAKKFVKAIKEEVEFDPLLADLKPEQAASDFEFNLRGCKHEQGYSCVAAGIKTSLTGSRSDIYIFDDPEPEVDPEPARERIIQAFGEANDILHVPDRHLYLMADENGEVPTEIPVPERTQMIIIGQPHCVTTAYLPSPGDEDDEEGHPLRDAKYLLVPVLKRDGSFRWPDMMTRKYFNHAEGRPMTPAEVKRRMPLSRWELQYMINTGFAAIAGPVLRVGEIELGWKLPSSPIMVVDPADSEGGAEWGVAIMGLVDRKIHICHLDGFQAEAYEGDWESSGQNAWRRVFDLATEFRCRRVYLEVNLKAAASACRRYIAKTPDVRATVFEFRATRNKKIRIPSLLEQPINNRMVTANPGVMADKENVKQLRRLRWDKLPNPCDRIDALAAGFEILFEEPALTAGGDPGMAFAHTGRPTAYTRMDTSNSFDRIR